MAVDVEIDEDSYRSSVMALFKGNPDRIITHGHIKKHFPYQSLKALHVAICTLRSEGQRVINIPNFGYVIFDGDPDPAYEFLLKFQNGSIRVLDLFFTHGVKDLTNNSYISTFETLLASLPGAVEQDPAKVTRVLKERKFYRVEATRASVLLSRFRDVIDENGFGNCPRAARGSKQIVFYPDNEGKVESLHNLLDNALR